MTIQSNFSKLFTVAALSSSILAVGPGPNAEAATLNLSSIDHLYVFGDSLVDTGNLFNALGGVYPSPLQYAPGRFSNGPLWVEDLSLKLGLPFDPATDYAYGGSSSGLGNAVLPIAPFPGLLGQVSLFAGATTQADPNGLYVLSAGANDYIFGGVTSPTQPVANLTQAVLALTAIGAKNILVPNLVDLGQLPGTRTTLAAPFLTSVSSQHNQALASSLSALQSQVAPDVNLLLLDARALFDRGRTTPSEFGLTNTTDPCLNGFSSCSNPEQYLFWDDYHPTAKGHALLADYAYSSLQTAAVPEPSSVLGVVTMGVLGAGWRRARRSKSKVKL